MTSIMDWGNSSISTPPGGGSRIGKKFGTNPLFRRPTMAQPPVPTAPQGTFGPGNDLRARQIDPTPSTRLTGAQGMTNTAAAGVQGFNRGNAVNGYMGQFNNQLGVKPVGMRAVNPNVTAGQVNTQVGYNPVNTNVNTRGVNTQVGFNGVNPNVQAGQVNTQASFNGVDPNVQARSANTQVQGRSLFGQGMPSRTDLAKRALSDFTEQSALDRNQGIRQIGQSAARFGRIGAGMTTNDLTGLEANLDRNRRSQETQLASSVAEGDIGDRFRDRDYLTDVDTQNVGRDMQDRDYLTGVDERNYGRATNERDTELGVQERNIGRGMQDRDYQTDIDTQNVGRQMSERDTAMGLGERNVGRDMADRDFTTGLDERNLGRQSDERGFATGLGERNVGRATDERNFQTGLNERNTNRDYGMAQDQAGLDERNAGRDFDSRRAALSAAMGMGEAEQGDAMDKFNTASGYERGIYGQEAADRDEIRGERGYQEGQSRYANEQRIRQREMENKERDAEFDRAAMRSQLQMRGSAQVGQGAEGANDLLMDYMRRRTASGARPQAPAPRGALPTTNTYGSGGGMLGGPGTGQTAARLPNNRIAVKGSTIAQQFPTTRPPAIRPPATPSYTPQAIPRPKVTVKGKGRGF